MSFKRIASRSLSAASSIFLSRVLGFVREVLTAAFFGANHLTDAFFLAWKVPNIFRRVLGEGALEKVFIPYLRNAEGEEFKRAVLGYLLLLSSLVVFLLFLFAPFVVELFSHSSDRVFLEKATLFLRYLSLYLLFAFLNAYFSALLQFKGKFFKPYLSQAIFNLTLIVFVLLFHKGLGIFSLVLGALLGGLAQVVYILLVAGAEGVLVLPSLKPHPRLGSFFKNLIPSFASAGVGQLATLVEVYLATAVGGGVLSALYYAFRLFQLPISLVGVAVGRVALTELSTAKGEVSKKLAPVEFEIKRRLLRATEVALFFAVPTFLALFFLSKPIVEVVYTRGAFTEADAQRTALYLKIYSLGLLFAILYNLVQNLYFVKGRFFTLFSISLLWFLTEAVIGFGSVFIFHLGGWVIALSYALGGIITFFASCLYAKLCPLVFRSLIKLRRFFLYWIITAAVLFLIGEYLGGFWALLLSAPLGVFYLWVFKGYLKK